MVKLANISTSSESEHEQLVRRNLRSRPVRRSEDEAQSRRTDYFVIFELNDNDASDREDGDGNPLGPADLHMEEGNADLFVVFSEYLQDELEDDGEDAHPSGCFY